MKKIVVGLLLVLSIVLGAVLVRMHLNTDSVPPVITLPSEEAVYEEGMDKAELLAGVTAVDDVDGDVSDSLMVESVIPMDDGLTATVIYYAKDRSNNVAKATRIVQYRYEDMEEWMEELEKMTEETEKSENETKGTDGQEESGTEKPESESEETAGLTEQEGEVYSGAKENEQGKAPKIELSAEKVNIQRGSSFNPLEYVKEITDDKDDRSHLFGQIHIDSNTVNTGVPGTYEVVFSVTDSDNNCSEQAVLTVIVEE